MRYVMIAAVWLSVMAAGQAVADAPNSITFLLGPSVGYLLGQSDLCQWGLTEKIEKTYKAGFQAIGMTTAQQAAAWKEARARQNGLASMPAKAKERMKAATCKPDFRARIEQNLTD